MLYTSCSLSYRLNCNPFINDIATLLQYSLSTDPSTLQLIVRAQVKKGYTPVIGAKVEVQVGSSPWKLMKDDGLGKLMMENTIC